MDARQPWADRHFLGAALQDALAGTPGPAPAALSCARSGAGAPGVRALGALRLAYAPPFPLAYVLHPRAREGYSALWVLLVQLRRARGALARIRVKGGEGEGRALWALRARLAWVVGCVHASGR
jgi:gamma-tubulin complex component 5